MRGLRARACGRFRRKFLTGAARPRDHPDWSRGLWRGLSRRAKLLAHHPEPVAAPENLAVDDECRHAEHADFLGLAANPVVGGTAVAVEEIKKPRDRRA